MGAFLNTRQSLNFHFVSAVRIRENDTLTFDLWIGVFSRKIGHDCGTKVFFGRYFSKKTRSVSSIIDTTRLFACRSIWHISYFSSCGLSKFVNAL